MVSRIIPVLFAGFAVLCLSVSGAAAAEHVIEMLNDGGDGQYMVFKPDYLEVEVGDTIKFEPVDPGHNAVTIPEVWPEGVPHVEGEISEPVSFTVEKEGVYGIKCVPHFMMGMIALIVAGEPVNAAQAESFEVPAMGKERYDSIKSKLEADE
ncbi:pseudoazurin [Methyloligella sp. 2.7D]|uniref:pseudoazurin n=1 Tax=unclassified Methyloligella TaxID=2625955 RepID=UPI00157E2309|nr:pseudoazurin [Methyloligella sp. GL2]QKP76529.1 pseudoazurin [Methyloligella sp. GL2]